MILPVASVVTEKTICEFDLLKKSLELFHECFWVISCDKSAAKKYEDIENIHCLQLIKSDDCDHNIGSPQQKDRWMKVMMTKFDAVSMLVDMYGHGLFLDSDMVFVNPIEQRILNLLENKNIDAFICQHMSNDWQNEAKHGLYNGGMFHIKNKNFIKDWINLSLRYKEYNLYYEQQPLEYIQRNYNSMNLPINYNIGWWRFNNDTTRNRLDKLRLVDDRIYFGNKPAVNFHVHTLREIGYQNFGQFLVDKICSLLADSGDDVYQDILREIKS
jgi:hypothetical protein